MSSDIKVDTISENTSANGVAIDGLTLKDGAIGTSGTATSVAGITFHRNGDDDGTSIYTADVSGTDNLARSNTGFGMTALDAITTGDNNAVFGYAAATAMNTGVENTAIGRGAMQSATSAAYNTCLGKNTGNSLTEGNLYNVLIGNEAGLSITTGSYNMAIGANAMDGFDTETHNLGIGYDSMGGSVAGGEYNVCVGNYAGAAVTSGDTNTYVGYEAGVNASTSNHNVFIGKGAGSQNTTGVQNVCVGSLANTYDADDFNQINIGYDNPGIASNVVCLGIAGTNNIYATFTSSASWTKNSDERIKKNITTNTKAGLDFINELRTVTYNKKRVTEFDPSMELYKATEDESDKLAYYDGTLYGLIAQEVKTAMDKHGISDFDGWHEQPKGDKIQGIAESQFVIPLIKAVQELSAKVKALEEA